MFDRFTPSARRVVGLARLEALKLGHTWIGTEHLLLALFEETTGVVAQAWKNLGVTRERMREVISELSPASASPSPSREKGQLPFTHNAKRALEATVLEAAALKHKKIGTEHILLGLVSTETLAGHVLNKVHVTSEAVKREILAPLKQSTLNAQMDRVEKEFILDALKKAPPSLQAGEKTKSEKSIEKLKELLAKNAASTSKDTINTVAASSANVLVRAELERLRHELARRFHTDSPRAGGPFVKVDCADLLAGELAPEIFGRVNARQDVIPGALERANGGTLFLDEVDDLPEELQERLAQTLASGEYKREGSNSVVKLGDVRIVSGTTVDLVVLTGTGRFRADLFARLNGIAVGPPTSEVTKPIEKKPETPPTLPTKLAGYSFVKPPKPIIAIDAVKKFPTHHAPGVPMGEIEIDRTLPLFDRLAPRAQRVLEGARDAARRLGHPAIGSEHILLGIAREGSGIAAIVLLELLGDLAKIDEAVGSLLLGAATNAGFQPFAPSAQATLDIADEIAQDLGKETVEPEHLLLGMARDAEGSGRILVTLGVDLAELAQRVRERQRRI